MRKTITKNNLSAKEWNEHYPAGTNVLYYPVCKFPEFKLAKTTSAAYELCGMQMVDIDIMGGGVNLQHLVVQP